MTEYIDINALRRPEALNERIYHPCHYGEADRMLERAENLEKLSMQVMERLCDREKDAYYSMIHFSAMASMNLLKMHLYAGKNNHYARQGRPVANSFGRLSQECADRDIQGNPVLVSPGERRNSSRRSLPRPPGTRSAGAYVRDAPARSEDSGIRRHSIW